MCLIVLQISWMKGYMFRNETHMLIFIIITYILHVPRYCMYHSNILLHAVGQLQQEETDLKAHVVTQVFSVCE